MYIVKRPFRNFGKTLTVGTVIENPALVKRFKTRFAEGKIIEVTEKNYRDNAAYFKAKYGVTLPIIQEEKPVEEPKRTVEAPKVMAKVSAK